MLPARRIRDQANSCEFEACSSVFADSQEFSHRTSAIGPVHNGAHATDPAFVELKPNVRPGHPGCPFAAEFRYAA